MTREARKTRKNPQEQLAEILFIDADYTFKQIAEELGKSEKTIGAWAKKGNWEDDKKVRNLSPDLLINDYMNDSQRIRKQAKDEERPLTSKECDALNKLAAAIERLDKKVSPSINMAVFMRFNNYLKVIDNDLVKKLLPYQKDFVQALLSSK